MKATILSLAAIALAPFTPLTSDAQAQQRNSYNRTENAPRFPSLRQAFRQIRGDLRLAKDELRDTATFIRDDLRSEFEQGFQSGEQRNNYGYRGDYEYTEQPRNRQDPDRRRVNPAPAKRTVEIRPSEPEWMKRAKAEKKVRRHIPYPANPDTKKKPTQPEILTDRARPKPATKKQTPTQPIVKPREVAKKKSPPKETAPVKKKFELEPKTELPTDKSGKDTEGSKPAPRIGKKVYPIAKPSTREGFHYSPFEPFELLDTSDIKPGGLARDPGSGKIFRLPK